MIVETKTQKSHSKLKTNKVQTHTQINLKPNHLLKCKNILKKKVNLNLVHNKATNETKRSTFNNARPTM